MALIISISMIGLSYFGVKNQSTIGLEPYVVRILSISVPYIICAIYVLFTIFGKGNAFRNLKGKRVLVRCDFNVPLQDGKITDENRLVAALPTIKKLVADGGKIILCSHLGKPKGEPKPELSLMRLNNSHRI